MQGFRIVWKGLRSVSDHLFRYLLASCLWYLAVVLVVAGPAATLALFRMTDPRWGFEEEPQTWGEIARYTKDNLWRGWKLALLTAPLILLFLYNIGYYGANDSRLGALTPLWFVLLVFGVTVTLIAYAVAAISERPALETLRLSAGLTAARLPRVFLTLLLTLLIGVICFALTPFLLLYPAVVSSIVNRLVLDGLRIPIPDPTAPTPERQIERNTRPR